MKEGRNGSAACVVCHNPEDLPLPAFAGGRFQSSHSTGMKVAQCGIKTAVAHPTSGFELLHWPSRGHRIIQWFELEGTLSNIWSSPPAMGRGTFH